jgi:hypothetical protein
MRRVMLLPSALLALSACTPGGSAPPPPLAAPFELQVGFSSGGLADTISITALDRLPLHAAELIAPDGAAAPANWIDVNARPRAATGQWVANSPWETALAGTGAAALASPNAEANAALRSQVQVLAVLSQAEIPLPDPVAYRRDWATYRVRLTFGTPPSELESREVAAPSPPPQPAAPPPTPAPPPG